ncbi:HTTM domain-containing protein [bacterium]|nr:HTTM domain-containing protein [bacterium]
MLHVYKLTSQRPIILFQFVFGLYLSVLNAKYLYFNWLPDLYINPIFHSKYPIFQFHVSLPLAVHIFLYITLVCCGLGIAFKVQEKLCTMYALLISLFYFLFDRLYYSDFSYLNLLFLLSLLVINWSTRDDDSIPKWKVLWLKSQFWIVAFIAMLHLMTTDFLDNHVWIARLEIFKFHSFLNLLSTDSIASFGVYFTIILYAICLLFLITKKLKKIGLLLWIGLQTSLYILFYKFEIQVDRANFPMLMIIGSLTFVEDNWIQSLKTTLHRSLKKTSSNSTQPQLKKTSGRYFIGPQKLATLTTLCLLIFMSIQLLLPLRGYVVGHHDREWTNGQNIFSWRMKLKQFYFYGHLTVKDLTTGTYANINIYDYHLPSGPFRMGSPYSILKFAQFLENKYNNEGHTNIAIYASIFAKLNNDTTYKPLIDPSIDLTTVTYKFFSSNNWILPYD